MNWEDLINALIQNKEIAAIVVAVVAWWNRRKLGEIYTKFTGSETTDSKDKRPEMHAAVIKLADYGSTLKCKRRKKKVDEAVDGLKEVLVHKADYVEPANEEPIAANQTLQSKGV